MIFSPSTLYRDGNVCKLCEGEGNHADGCPTPVVESLRWEIRYSGPYCHRSCCGSTSGTASGATLDDCVRSAAAGLSETVSQSCRARLVAEQSVDVDRLVADEMERRLAAKVAREAAEEAEAEARRLAEERAAALAALEAERDELKPEAYDRRLRALTEAP